MDIPLNVDVRCASSSCGTSVALVLNPVNEEVTHLVVKEKEAPHIERMVPVDSVGETTPERINLKCSVSELQEMGVFSETDFVQVQVPHYLPMGGVFSYPYVVPDPRTETVPVQREHIPPHELAVRRGAQVHATDGHIGKVDEFLVDPANCHVTHLVMREGHLWAQRDVVIPISQIDRMDEYTVYLKLDKREVAELPEIPIHRGILG